MAVRKTDISDRIQVTQIEYLGDEVQFGYYPGKLTPKRLRTFMDLKDTLDTDTDAIGEAFAPLLAWWDVLDDDGQRIPPSVEEVGGMPLDFIIALVTRIVEVVRPPAPAV